MIMDNFNPSRLNEARLYRKMTIEELANNVGVKKQAISQFENGKNSPEFDTLRSISSVLNFPIRFFIEDSDSNILVGNTYFRAPFSSNKKDLNSQRIKARYVAYIQSCLSEYVDFPPLNLPRFDDIDNIEQIANQARDFWGLGREPISDMVALLERNGVIVSEFSTEGKTIDAFYQYGEVFGQEYYCVVLGTDKLTFTRRQFSAAHELAHILLHERNNDIDELDRVEFRKREDEANKFASAFLLPKEAFIRDVQPYANKLNYYIELKRKWKVSISAMIIRAFDLEVISSNQYQYLMRQMSRNDWRSQEPLDDYMAVKGPKALKQAINMLILNDYLTPKQMFQLFAKYKTSLPKDVIDEVLCLEPDTLPDEPDENLEGKIITLVPRMNLS
ncbi:putative Zn peptidase [Desulfitobacterium dehalogenans ATCC 51507]|uniref:Putative Zn peptidase n=2 Tax=Desulfitobacterium dehalogenans TaxID=36854 RepID=I4A4X0_DESDJ|nr:putative Zn peptidase [Desulfitobacterium dehalogenans ATCC 51507]